MKLIAEGFIHRLGQGVPLRWEESDLPSLLHQKKTQGVPDGSLCIDELGERQIKGRFFFFDDEHPFVLNIGESHQIKHDGNAFGFTLIYTLEE